jgi:hypothetical protein
VQLNNLSTSQRPADAARMAGIVRLIRRVCVLCEQGDAAQAARLQENELATAVRDFRLALGPDVLPENELQAIFATEGRRVADASVLAELLLPRLVEYLPAIPGPVRSGSTRPKSELLPAAAQAAAGPPAIPDLLDAMLAAERTGRRLSPASKRES